MNLILTNIMRICTAIVANYVLLVILLVFANRDTSICWLALMGMSAAVVWAGLGLVGDIYHAVQRIKKARQ